MCSNPFVTHSEIKHLKPFMKVVLLMSSISKLKSSLSESSQQLLEYPFKIFVYMQVA